MPDFGVPPFEAHTGEHYAFSQTADISYKRLTGVMAVPSAGGDLTFWASYNLEAAWDHLFVEARSAAAATGRRCQMPTGTLRRRPARAVPRGGARCTPTSTTTRH